MTRLQYLCVEPLESRRMLSANPLTVSGRVFVDQNANASFESSMDQPLNRWVVWADANANNRREATELVDRTNASGRYEIQFPDPGTYRVRRAYTSEYDSANSEGAWITLNGTDPVVLDFVLQEPASPEPAIRGTVFDDMDGDGIQDFLEPGLDRVVWLDSNNNARREAGEAFDRTNARGEFEFEGLNFGSYDVRVAGLSASSTPQFEPTTFAIPGRGQLAQVTVSSTHPETEIEFGRRRSNLGGNGRVSGIVYSDVDQDGRRISSIEHGIRNRVVWVDLDGDGKRDADEPHDRTNFAGEYRIGGVPFGTTSHVRIAGLGDWIKTTPNSVSVSFGSEEQGPIEFGQFSPSEPVEVGSAMGRVWNDLDANSRRDDGESSLQGEIVYADLNKNGIRDANEPFDATNSNGVYNIGDIPVGIREIRLEEQTGFVTTTRLRTAVVNTEGTSLSAIGTNAQASVSGIAFYDSNGNGRRDADEPGLSGIRIWNELDLSYLDAPETAKFETSGFEPNAISSADGSFFISSVVGGSSARTVKQQFFVEPIDATNGFVVTGSEFVELRVVSGQSITGVEIGLAGPDVITREIWNLESRAFSSQYLFGTRGFRTQNGVDIINFSWGLDSLSRRLQDEWVVTTTSTGTTLKSVGSQRYLAADGLWNVAVDDGVSPTAYWTISTNSDGSISLRNQSNGRYLDADNDRTVGLSEEIRHDDGWFVSEIEL